jgi:hypothetical protein
MSFSQSGSKLDHSQTAKFIQKVTDFVGATQFGDQQIAREVRL